MNPTVRRFPWTVGVGLVLVILMVSIAFVFTKAKAEAERRESLPIYGPVADFSLTNQNNAAVSLADLRGRVWIADIIFTRCPGPCLRMTRQMKELQEALPKDARTKLISLTTDPDYDTPAILKTYAERAGADWSRWTFLTGTKIQIADLATGSLKLSAVEKKPGERASPDDLWVHSTIFVIVDKHAQLRGVFQTGGEDVDWKVEKQKILDAAQQLEREP
ncbi:MAG TPA: SCO family protein [Verrucomicrobiae bacterium]|jgi:protein SCO1/2|nr:SCO family protein [Verrucomicrobiae bacterium]